MMALLIVLGLLVSSPVGAQPEPGSAEAGRRIRVSAGTMSQGREVRISAKVATNLLFDTPVQLSALEERQSFRRVAVMEDSILLVASHELKWGTRLRMAVRFPDGANLAGVNFVLRVVPPEQAERQIEVNSLTTSGSCQEARDEIQQCRAELERKCETSKGQSGLTTLLASEWLDVRGVLALPLKALTWPAGQSLRSRDVLSYRVHRAAEDGTTPHVVRVAVALWMRNEGLQSWMAAGAELVAEDGKRHALSVWQSAPVEPGARQQRVVVEAEMKETDVRGRFTLELWDEGHPHPATFGGVSFP